MTLTITLLVGILLKLLTGITETKPTTTTTTTTTLFCLCQTAAARYTQCITGEDTSVVCSASSICGPVMCRLAELVNDIWH